MAHRWFGLMLAAGFLILAAQAGASSDRPPTREEVERMMGLRSEGDLVRGQMDTVGFVVTREQAEDVLSTARRLDGEALAEPPRTLVAAVCPHDDHLYAARVALHATERIDAPRILLLGVFHKAWVWKLHDRLVFDAFQAWHGPWGPVPVDPLREELLRAMPRDMVLVDDTMHCREHSLEAIVPFLQGHRRDVTIVPVLVPYMDWSRLEEVSEALAAAVAAAMRRHGWQLGRDLAIVISSDAVHYGSDFDHAPWGEDLEAYRKAVEREHDLISRHLEGRLEAARLHALLDRLVDPADVVRYRIPWCGRFSVPFGLETLRRLAGELALPVPEGVLLRYGTSVSEAELPVSAATREAGLGYTAPSNFHHWVGYAAVGWTVSGTAGGE